MNQCLYPRRRYRLSDVASGVKRPFLRGTVLDSAVSEIARLPPNIALQPKARVNCLLASIVSAPSRLNAGVRKQHSEAFV